MQYTPFFARACILTLCLTLGATLCRAANVQVAENSAHGNRNPSGSGKAADVPDKLPFDVADPAAYPLAEDLALNLENNARSLEKLAKGQINTPDTSAGLDGKPISNEKIRTVGRNNLQQALQMKAQAALIRQKIKDQRAQYAECAKNPLYSGEIIDKAGRKIEADVIFCAKDFLVIKREDGGLYKLVGSNVSEASRIKITEAITASQAAAAAAASAAGAKPGDNGK